MFVKEEIVEFTQKRRVSGDMKSFYKSRKTKRCNGITIDTTTTPQ